MRLTLLLCLLTVFVMHSIAFGDEAAEQLMLATYKLANESSTATGLVVRCETAAGKMRCFVVTAHHVLEQVKGESVVLVARSRRDNGTFQRREITVPIHRNGVRLWKKHAKHDLAVLPLPDSVSVESLPCESLATETALQHIHAGDDLRLAVFPERSEANGAGFPILRSGSLASYPLLPVQHSPMFLVDTNAWGGDSGGPVMHATQRAPGDLPLVIGVVQGKRRITDTVKESRFVERITHYPLGISEVLHATLARELLESCCAEDDR